MGKSKFIHLNDAELTALVKEKFSGVSITEVEDLDGSFMNVLRARNLITQLVNEGVLVRKSFPAGFYESMSNDELIDYGRQNYLGKGITELEKSRGAGKGNGFIKVIRARGLVNRLVELNILERRADNTPRYKDMPEEQFVTYIIREHSGKSLTQICKDEKTVYNEIQKRGLADSLIATGTIITKDKTKKGRYANMTDQEIIDEVKNKHAGITVSDLEERDCSLMGLARQRGLDDALVEQGVLIRRISRKNPITNVELLNAARKYEKGTNINVPKKQAPGLYNKLEERKLLPMLITEGTFVVFPKRRSISSLTNEQLIDYVKENYSGLSIGQLEEVDQSLMDSLRRRKLSSILVEKGILKRIRRDWRSETSSDASSILLGYVNA